MALALNDGFEDIHGLFYEAPVFEECEDEKEIQVPGRHLEIKADR